MKIITKYQAIDGSEWNTEEECNTREKMIEQVDNAMSLLKPIPKELNWEGYVQQSAEVVKECKRKLFNIVNQKDILGEAIKWQIKKYDTKFEEVYSSWFCGMLDENNAPLYNAYNRLCNIDKENKEWNQPYYATNKSTRKDVRIG
ncbi:MAG: hypothetical protein M0P71_01730 [Melioribacteraceae bacterium]|nr:hypothetical protein [Melioribacteraceae bacterium]